MKVYIVEKYGDSFTNTLAVFVTELSAKEYLADANLVHSGDCGIAEVETGWPMGHDKPVKVYQAIIEIRGGGIREHSYYVWEGEKYIINTPPERPTGYPAVHNWPIRLMVESVDSQENANDLARTYRNLLLGYWKEYNEAAK